MVLEQRRAVICLKWQEHRSDCCVEMDCGKLGGGRETREGAPVVIQAGGEGD